MLRSPRPRACDAGRGEWAIWYANGAGGGGPSRQTAGIRLRPWGHGRPFVTGGVRFSPANPPQLSGAGGSRARRYCEPGLRRRERSRSAARACLAISSYSRSSFSSSAHSFELRSARRPASRRWRFLTITLRF